MKSRTLTSKTDAVPPIHSPRPQAWPASPLKKQQNQDDDDKQPNPSMGTVSDSVTTSWERAQQGENQDDDQDRVEHRRLSRLLSGLSILFRAASAFKMLTNNASFVFVPIKNLR
jgi:hypothetical protein